MLLNPLDIRKHEFTRAWRGYDREEVHALLDALAREWEEMSRRHQALAEEARQTGEELGRYRQSEKTLQDAALSLQRTLEEKRRAAEEEAARLLQDARDRAGAEERLAREQIDALRAELRALEEEKARFRLRFRDLLRSQGELLDSMLGPGETPADSSPQA